MKVKVQGSVADEESKEMFIEHYPSHANKCLHLIFLSCTSL